MEEGVGIGEVRCGGRGWELGGCEVWRRKCGDWDDEVWMMVRCGGGSVGVGNGRVGCGGGDRS